MSAGASASEAAKEAPETSKIEPPRTIVLRSLDGGEFEVDLGMATQSELIKGMIKKMIDTGYLLRILPIFNVDGPALAKVVEYWKQHASGEEDDDDLRKWDEAFVKMPKEELLKVTMAAKHLDTKPLFELCCQAVADAIKHMPIPDVLKYFGM